MTAQLISRSAVAGLLIGGATALTVTLAPAAAAASPLESPQDELPVSDAPITELPDPGGPGEEDGPGEQDDGEDGEGGEDGEVGDPEIVEIPDDVLCALLETCDEEGEGAEEEEGDDGAADENCEMVHTPFGKIWVCDEDDEPDPPEGCDYLLDNNGNWSLECPDDTPPPPEDCQYLLDLDGDWVLECPDDTPPPPEGCDYLLDLDGNWSLDCPDDTPEPCEDSDEDNANQDDCDEPEDTPRDSGKAGLPLTGPSTVVALASLSALLLAGGGVAVFLARRRSTGAEDPTDEHGNWAIR